MKDGDDSLPASGQDLIPVYGEFRRSMWDVHTGHPGRALLHFGLAAVEGATLVSPIRSGAKFGFRMAQRMFVREVVEETGVIVGSTGLSTSAEILETLASSEGSTTSVITNLTGTPAAGQQLYVAVGENAEALANSVGAVRGAGQNFAARIPTALINELERVGLARTNPVIMQNAAGQVVGKGTEIWFHPTVTKYIVPFFK